jgi:hypothetical protein
VVSYKWCHTSGVKQVVSYKWCHTEYLSYTQITLHEDSNFLGCDAVSWCEWFPTFRKIVVPCLWSFKQSKKNAWTDWTSKLKAKLTFETSATTHTTTRHRIQEDLKPHHQCCEKLKPRIPSWNMKMLRRKMFKKYSEISAPDKTDWSDSGFIQFTPPKKSVIWWAGWWPSGSEAQKHSRP